MKKLIDINVEDYKSALEKITINIKNFSPDNFSIIKCYKNFEEILTIECKKINLIKVHKTILLNIPNLISLDLRENKLLKISKHLKLLKNLKSLKLDDNCISFIPNFIGHFDKLDTLTLCNNRITYIPTSIQSLQNLKVFKLSGNQIIKLPIEFGLLKAIECLYIDCNYFTEIPTTLCYLKQLSEFAFEWLEFLDPPFSKTIKESIGTTIICLIRDSLQDMLKNNILYCDFQTFIERNSYTNLRKESPMNQVTEEPISVAAILHNKKTLSHCSFPDPQADDKVVTTACNNTIEKEDPTSSAIPLDSKLTLHNTRLPNKQSESSAATKFLKIFSAVENNYYGVIKAFLQNNEEYLKIKNADNKMALHLAIQVGKPDIINLILSKINFRTAPMSHTYLHKAIRLRQPLLVEKLLELGIDVNSPDDQGSTCFHILFNAFTKNLSKCALIGDCLLKNGATFNNMNNDNWAPIHIAARRASKECLVWILQQNSILKRSGKETFDLNASGKNKWTPLHLAVSSFRIEESLLLLNSDCDVFAKNSDRRTPRKVTNGNFLLARLLRNYEVRILMNKYNNSERKVNNGNNQICLTTIVEDSSNLEEASIKCKPTDLFSDDQSKPPSPLASTQITFQVNLNGNSNIEKESGSQKILTQSKKLTGQQSNSLSKLNLDNEFKDKLGKSSNGEILKEEVSKSIAHTEKKSANSKQNTQGQSNGKITTSSHDKNKTIVIKQQGKDLSKIGLTTNNPKNTESPSILQNETNPRNSSCLNMNSFKTRVPTKQIPSITKMNSIVASIPNTNGNNFLKSNETRKEQFKVNLHFHKEVILSNDSTFTEKYESLMYIKLSSSSPQNRNIELENVIKSIIEGLDLENEVNSIIFSDICNLIIINQYFNLTSFLEVIHKTFTLGTKKKYINAFLEKELTNTILILKATQDSLKRTVIFNYDLQTPRLLDHGVATPSQNSFRKIKKVTQAIEQNSLNPISQRMLNQEFGLESSMMNYNSTEHMKNIPKKKKLEKYFITQNESDRLTEAVPAKPKQVDEYNYDEMNEIRESYIDLKAYNNQVPHKKIHKDCFYGIENSESCNIQDSSFSMARLDPPVISKTSRYALMSKLDNSVNNENKEDELFTIIIPQKTEPVYFETETAEQN